MTNQDSKEPEATFPREKERPPTLSEIFEVLRQIRRKRIMRIDGLPSQVHPISPKEPELTSPREKDKWTLADGQVLEKSKHPEIFRSQQLDGAGYLDIWPRDNGKLKVLLEFVKKLSLPDELIDNLTSRSEATADQCCRLNCQDILEMGMAKSEARIALAAINVLKQIGEAE